MNKKLFFLLLLFMSVFTTTWAQNETIIVEDDEEEELASDSLANDTIFNIDAVQDTEEEKVLTWAEKSRRHIDKILNKNYTQTVTKTYTVKVPAKGKGKKKKKATTKTVKKTTTVGIPFTAACYVYDLTADSTIYEFNANKMMIPASNQKLFVSISMLAKYGEKFVYNTTISTNGSEAVDSLGNIYLDGDILIHTTCDPTLSSDGAREIKNRIEALGYDSINGGIVLCTNDKTDRMRLAEDNFAPQVAKMLKSDTVKFSRGVSWGKITSTDKGEYLLGSLQTPLKKVLRRMMKNSDNTYAESMLLNLVENDESWTYDSCRNVVRTLMKNIRKQYHPDEDLTTTSKDYYEIIDGSGLSHSNKTTARALADLLRFAYHNKKVYGPLYEALPIAGVDGTIGGRMRKGTARDNVHAKTGTVTGVSTLSGYAKSSEGHDIAFSILFNNCGNKTFARSLQDQVCEILTE